MKPKTVVLLIIILAAIGGGLYLFQKDKQEKALIAHNKNKFQQITKVAKKSVPAGLLNMALAINKFHQVKGHYPEDLYKLYPDFIPEKSFISTIEWGYTTGKGSYLLKKSIEGEQIYASMGPDLKLKTGKRSLSTEKEMVADTTTSKKAAVPTGGGLGPDLKRKTKTIQQLKKPALDTKTTSKNLSSGNKRKKSKTDSTIRIVKKELNKNEKFLLSFADSGLYIWKTKEGIIGFSNIQYPEKKGLTMYRDQGWVEYIDRQK